WLHRRLLLRLFVVIHGFAKALDRFANVAAQTFEFLGAEYQYHDNQDDDPVFPVKNTHEAFLVEVSSSKSESQSAERAAFSACPDRPKRRSSSSSTDCGC